MSIRTVLSGLNVPVRRPDYKGDAPQYITYHLLGEVGTIYAEGKAAETGTRFSVDIWSKTDYISLPTSVRSALQNANYTVVVLAEYFESNSGYYHVVLEACCVGAHYG